ncbi:hypothetical protein A2529_05470 [Candidatus Peribacteria bacterium RIFOXYD2_FULL_58_15]|nr:MAG: hypothetical protein A2529_05470 [Candidatus Peribacteria bacterium RIFOXYD2_FULL_58_15]
MDSQHSNSIWFSISMGLLGVIVGYGLSMAVGKPAASTTPPPTAAQPNDPGEDQPTVVTVKAVDETDHIRGSKDAKLTLFVYSDFECPYCSRHHPTLKQLLQAYPDDVNMVFRHFPLSFHSNAQKASEAAECAAEQGGDDAFWQMHDMLFEKGVGADKYSGYAKDLKLNVTKFDDCLSSGRTAEGIKADEESGTQAGVRGTPATIIYSNETKEAQLISGALPLANFKTTIDGILK